MPGRFRLECVADFTGIGSQVWNIHNTDMKHATIWTNSLLLYPDKVVVKTCNHQDNVWLPELERAIPAPQPGIRPITTPARSD